MLVRARPKSDIYPPEFLFLQAAMEPLDVAVAFQVMIRRLSMRRAARVFSRKREEVNCVPLSVECDCVVLKLATEQKRVDRLAAPHIPLGHANSAVISSIFLVL